MIYSLETSGQASERAVVRWGLSRFGDSEDPEMYEAIKGDRTPGDGLAVYTSWTPKPIKTRSAEQILAQRISNARKRAERFPLFADQFLEDELAKEKNTLEACEADRIKRIEIWEEFERKYWEYYSPDKQVVLEAVRV